MRFLFETAEVTKTTLDAWLPFFIQLAVTAGAIFGGTGFWQWKQANLQAKRDKESKDSGVESKVDTLTKSIKTLSDKVDVLSDDMKEIKDDIALLEQANMETIRYRELREKNDAEASVAQKAIIESLAGILRERLLENYKRCIKKGYYTENEREVYKEMYKCYTQPPFNGNGVIHDLQPIMVNLPWTAEEAGILHDEDSED